MLNIDDRLLEKLNESEMFLCMNILKYMQTNRMTAWPSLETLSKSCRWDERTTKKWRQSLFDKGVIRIVEQPGKSNIYSFSWDGFGVWTPAKNVEVSEIQGGAINVPPAKNGGTKNVIEGGHKMYPELINKELVNNIKDMSGKPDDTEILPLEEKKKKEKVHPAAALEKKIEALREKLKTASDQERVKIIKEGKSLKAQLETEAQIDAVILRLNEKAGFRYELTAKEARRVIGKRLSENTIEEIFQVVDFKIKEWNGTEWHKYLRPETLLNGHFEGYYQASLLPKSKPTTQQKPVYEKPKKYLSEIDGIIFHK